MSTVLFISFHLLNDNKQIDVQFQKQIRPAEIPVLPGSWVTNTPSVKMLYPEKIN